MKDLLTDYGKAVDVLVATISDKNFTTNFNKTVVLEKINLAAPLITAEKQAQENFITDTMEQYGFDRETAEIMWKVWQGINDKYQNETSLEKSWYFSRALSQFIYSGNKWTAGAGFVFAGNTYEDAKNYFVNELGLKENEFSRLWYMVRLQSQVDSGDALSLNEVLKDTSLVNSYFNNYKNYVGPANLTLSEFLIIYTTTYNNMNEKTDFAHFSYVVAGNSITSGEHGSKTSYWGLWNTDEGRKNYIGWKGDATFAGYADYIFRNGVGEISFGNGDYTADLDAENIVNRMIKYNQTYDAASAAYYTDLKNNPEIREQEFRENHSTNSQNGYSNIEQDILSTVRCETIENLKDVYPGAYDFLMRIKYEENTQKKQR